MPSSCEHLSAQDKPQAPVFLQKGRLTDGWGSQVHRILHFGWNSTLFASIRKGATKLEELSQVGPVQYYN